MLMILVEGLKGIFWFIIVFIVFVLVFFMWVYVVIGVFIVKSVDVVRKNSMFLLFYNIVLILVIFFGFIVFFVLLEDINLRLVLLYLI